MTSICWKGIVIGSAYSLALHGGIATNMFGAASDVGLLRMADEAFGQFEGVPCFEGVSRGVGERGVWGVLRS